MRTIIGLAALARSGKDTVASMLLSFPGVAAFALADPLKTGCQALFGLTEAETWQDNLKETSIELWGKSPRLFFQTVGTDWMRHHNAEHWLMRAAREINPPERPSTPTALPDLNTQDAPFRLAAQAFFDFSDDQIWNPTTSRIHDEYWGLSPNDAVELLKKYTYDLLPSFDAIRSKRPIELPLRRSQVPSEAKTIIIKDIRFENEAAFLRSHNGEIWHISRPNLPRVNAHSSELGIARENGDMHLVNDGSLEHLQGLVAKAWCAHVERRSHSQQQDQAHDQTASTQRADEGGQKQ